MDVVGIIPARYEASRFPGKVLAKLIDKPMIHHVWERSHKSRLLEDLIIACDDERIKKTAESFGAKVVLTAKEHPSGTDRLTEIIGLMEVKVVINIQADEPLVHHSMIDGLAEVLLSNPDLVMATVIRRITKLEEYLSPNVVKVVKDKDDFALYFSRSPIPYLRKEMKLAEALIYKHIGLYGFSKDFLFTYKNLPISVLEKQEALEQLRVLEHGFRIKLIETNFDTVGVDTPEDLLKAEKLLQDTNA